MDAVRVRLEAQLRDAAEVFCGAVGLSQVMAKIRVDARAWHITARARARFVCARAPAGGSARRSQATGREADVCFSWDVGDVASDRPGWVF